MYVRRDERKIKTAINRVKALCWSSDMIEILYIKYILQAKWSRITMEMHKTLRYRYIVIVIAIAVTVGVDSVSCWDKLPLLYMHWDPHPSSFAISGLDFKLISVNNRIPCPCAFCDILSAKHIGHGISLFHYVLFCFQMRSDKLLSTNQHNFQMLENSWMLLTCDDGCSRKQHGKARTVHRSHGITVNHSLK